VIHRIKWCHRRIALVMVGSDEIAVEPLPNPRTGPSLHTI
jgi:hypothetical protein